MFYRSRTMPQRKTLASLSLLFALVLTGCSAIVTDEQAPGTYKAETDWGVSTIVIGQGHSFEQTVTPKNGAPKHVIGRWKITRNPGDTTYTTISLSPFFSVTHDKQGTPSLASAFSIYHVPFGGINIAADPDYGIAFRK
jgi:hypothetical protein